MQQTLYFFLVNQTLSDNDRKQLVGAFQQLDANNDGVLSRKEIQIGFEQASLNITKTQLEQIFKYLDNNDNDAIDYSEFVAAAIDRKKALSEEKLRMCFKMFDQNGDGNISLKEFKEILSGNMDIDN